MFLHNVLIEIRSYNKNVLLVSRLIFAVTKIRLFFHCHNNWQKNVFFDVLSICWIISWIPVKFGALDAPFVTNCPFSVFFVEKIFFTVLSFFYSQRKKTEKPCKKCLCLEKITYFCDAFRRRFGTASTRPIIEIWFTNIINFIVCLSN